MAEILNIIHIHLSDTSDHTSIDVVYLKKGETRDQHTEFCVDEMGTILRYRILVKNLTIFEILYNTGSSVETIPFEEIRFTVGEKYLIKGVEDLSPSHMFAIIKDIPLQMLSCAEQYRGFADTLQESKTQHFMFGQCQRRCFERLLGFVDLEIWSMDGLNTVSDEAFQVAIPACKLEIPDDMSLMLYESHLASKKEA